MDESFDGETFFLYVLLVAIALLVVFGINYFVSSKVIIHFGYDIGWYHSYVFPRLFNTNKSNYFLNQISLYQPKYKSFLKNVWSSKHNLTLYYFSSKDPYQNPELKLGLKMVKTMSITIGCPRRQLNSVSSIWLFEIIDCKWLFVSCVAKRFFMLLDLN